MKIYKEYKDAEGEAIFLYTVFSLPFIQRHILTSGPLLLCGLCFSRVKAKRELQCFHGSGVSSLLFWVEVALDMLCKNDNS